MILSYFVSLRYVYKIRGLRDLDFVLCRGVKLKLGQKLGQKGTSLRI
jgi:hypothetical protein